MTIKGLATRPTSLTGLTLYVDQGEADPIIMPALWERVQKDLSQATWKYIATSGFGPTTPEGDVIAQANGGVIRGNAW